LVSGGVWGQSVWNIFTNGGSWLSSGNWTPSGVPTSTGIARFGVNPGASPFNVGIIMSSISTNNGTNAQIVGAIEVTSARSNPLVIGNSSTTANGILTLNGISVNSVSNVVLRNNGSGLLTLRNTAGSGNKTMGVALGNATNNIINIDGTGGITISSIISGSNKLTKSGSGSGVLTLSGANTYSGGTVIASGTLSLGASGVLADAGTITLSGGTLRTGATFSETVGTLNLSDNSTITLGTGNHTLTFANSSGVSWTAGQTLTITGWTGTAGASGTAGKIVVGTGGLTTAQLAQVSFTGYSAGAAILGTGELVPVAPVLPSKIRYQNEVEKVFFHNFHTLNEVPCEKADLMKANARQFWTVTSKAGKP
jgi:autotransporter-associated beta strand protein